MEIDEDDEPLTPSGRMFLRPEMDQIIHCVFGFNKPIDIQSLKDEISRSAILAHPRFSSLLVHDRHGREHWRRTRVNVDRHFIVIQQTDHHHHHHHHPSPELTSDEELVNDYLADLSISSPLPTDKPLWEFHILNANKCVVMRVHHALGDGVSLMALMLTSCRRSDHPDMLPSTGPTGAGGGRSIISERRPRTIRKLVKATWITMGYVLDFIMRSLCVRDKTTPLSGVEGVELWPKKLATAKFVLEDMKIVKRAVPGATINDVLFAVISSGFSKYLQFRSPSGFPEGLRITGVAMFNLRSQPGFKDVLRRRRTVSGSGNMFGILMLPVYYNKPDGCNPLKHVEKAKEMMTKKKISLEAYFSYKLGQLTMSCFGPKGSSYLMKRVMKNTTFTISNVVGPQEDLTFAGHSIDYIRVSTTSVPHAITMHMVSYAGKADMQILVAKDVIPDPQILAKYFEDALSEMKTAAEHDLREVN